MESEEEALCNNIGRTAVNSCSNYCIIEQLGGLFLVFFFNFLNFLLYLLLWFILLPLFCTFVFLVVLTSVGWEEEAGCNNIGGTA